MDVKQKRLEIVLFLKQQMEEQGITQQQIANETGLHQSNVNRVFSGKYSPELDTLLKISQAIGFDMAAVKHHTPTIDEPDPLQQPFLFSVDPIENELFILHRNFPCCLIKVTQDLPSKFILVELYDDMDNPEDVLAMPFIQEAMIFYKEYASGLMGGNYFLYLG
jgi:transcriptional regulator with XRE-family HTH domain